jgi:hypothetical protein
VQSKFCGNCKNVSTIRKRGSEGGRGRKAAKEKGAEIIKW